MRAQFRDTVMELALQNEKIALIFGDVSVYLFNEFQKKYPNRFFNMGICESTLISVAAGLSAQGFIPFVHSIAPFITEHCLEQIKLDMCYNEFGGNIVSCGASFDYAWDGPSHFAYSDLAILAMLPNMEVIQPGSKKEVDVLMRSQFNNGKATYFRLSDYVHNFDFPVKFGKGAVLKDVGSKITVMTAGPILKNVMEACDKLDVNIVYFHTLKPIDRELILKFKDTQILVVHDAFGLYEAIYSTAPGLWVSYLGLPDRFSVSYGKHSDIQKELKLDPESLNLRIKKQLNHPVLLEQTGFKHVL